MTRAYGNISLARGPLVNSKCGRFAAYGVSAAEILRKGIFRGEN